MENKIVIVPSDNPKYRIHLFYINKFTDLTNMQWLHRIEIRNDYLTKGYFSSEHDFVAMINQIELGKVDYVLSPPSSHKE